MRRTGGTFPNREPQIPVLATVCMWRELTKPLESLPSAALRPGLFACLGVGFP